MSTIASIRIDEWGGRFIVVGEFKNFSQIPCREFDTYIEALKELAKIARQEEMRYEFGLRGRFDR